jgi:hypothetical protein
MVVVATNQLSAYFSLATLLDPCGHLFVHGLASRQLMLTLCQSDHFVQFTYSVGGQRARRSFLQLIWLACVWVVWNRKNHRLFRNAASPVHHLLDKIKMFSFRWPKKTNVTLVSNYHSWWSNSLFGLCID